MAINLKYKKTEKATIWTKNKSLEIKNKPAKLCVSQNKTFQSNCKFYVATADNILNFEIDEFRLKKAIMRRMQKRTGAQYAIL